MAHLPTPGFFFSVGIAGDDSGDAGFQEVSGISTETEMENTGPEGAGGFRYQVPERVTYNDLELSRGILTGGSPFADWCLATMNSGGTQKIEPKTVTVKLLDPNQPDRPLASWTFYNAYPVKWEVAGLQAGQTEMVVERMALAYSYFEKNPQ